MTFAIDFAIILRMSFDPTPEQQACIDAFVTGENMVIEAGAGTGKTSTLKLMAEATDRRGIYVAYNKAIATDAKTSFPDNVDCRTAHSLAYRTHAIPFKHRLNGPRVTLRDTVRILGISQPVQITDETALSPMDLARLAMDTVGRFCNSADPEITRNHVPFIPGAEDMDAIRGHVFPLAVKAWADICDKNGQLKFQHDHYLKMWALSNPVLNCKFVLLDEAQDANPVIAGVVEAQTHAQRVMVGDRCQAIYGWRGAVDAMSEFNGKRLILSQSFRFGPAIAEQANEWLSKLDAPLRLSGFDKIDSKVAPVETPDAILCRTNAEAIAQAMSYQDQGKTVALVGGADAIKRMAEAAQELQSGRHTSHPELVAFKSWQEVCEYAQEAEGRDLKVFVTLINNYGADAVIRVADGTVSEDRADIVISTAHKAKGREWDTVKIAGDFQPKDDSDEPMSRSEMMLLYVGVTRARLVLDNSALAFVGRRHERRKGEAAHGSSDIYSRPGGPSDQR